MIKPSKDNVIVVLEPQQTITKSEGGIHLVHNTSKKGVRASRWARVIASGPGYHKLRRRKLSERECTEETGVFVPNETRPGDRVLIDSDAGNDYAFDFSIPRHNVGHAFEELCGEKGEFRIVREDECHLIERDESEAVAAE